MISRLAFPADEAAYRALRLDGLQRVPTSFRITPADDAAAPRQLAGYTLHPDQAIFGAFDGTQLVGIVGFDREQREKMRHKGLIWGMYVAPEHSGRGLGRQLLQAAVAFARTVPGLEHMLLTVVATNANARGLYASEGFETIGLEPRAIKWEGQYFDEETMRYSL